MGGYSTKKNRKNIKKKSKIREAEKDSIIKDFEGKGISYSLV